MNIIVSQNVVSEEYTMTWKNAYEIMGREKTQGIKRCKQSVYHSKNYP